jgi:hypothetical protein
MTTKFARLLKNDIGQYLPGDRDTDQYFTVLLPAP